MLHIRTKENMLTMFHLGGNVEHIVRRKSSVFIGPMLLPTVTDVCYFHHQREEDIFLKKEDWYLD